MSPNASRILRFSIFVALLGLGVLALRSNQAKELLDPQTAVATLQQWGELRGATLLFVVASALAVSFGAPATIVAFAAAAVFGFVLGVALTWMALFLGAALSYTLATTLARDFVSQLLSSRIAPLERFLQETGFWTLLRLRVAPIPFAVSNYGIALLGVPPTLFFLTTALGLIPSVTMLTYFSSAFVEAAATDSQTEAIRDLFLGGFALLALSYVPQWIFKWIRRSDPPKS